MPLVRVWDVGLTDEQQATIQKGIADAYKEANPILKVHEELLWVVLHEVQPKSWMVGPLTMPQLRQKLGEETKESCPPFENYRIRP